MASSKSPPVTSSIGTAPAQLKGAPQRPPTLLEVVGQRLQASAPHSRQAVAAAGSKKNEERESARDDRPTVAPTLTAPKPELVAQPQAATSRVAEPAAIPPPSPLPFVAPAHLDDPSLRVVVLPTIARVNVETQDGGTISLQVRVHDGVTDVRASGSSAMLVDAHQGELRLALAHEGLKLGQFDLAQNDSGSSRRQHPEPREERASATTRRPPLRQQTTTTTLRADGRLSVKA